MTTHHHADPGRLARRLDLLIKGVTSTTGRRLSMQRVADTINEAAGKQLISASYLSLLRSGKRSGVNHERLAALADYFGVDVRYFTSDDVSDDPQGSARAQIAITNPLIRDIANAAHGLPAEDLEAILRLARAARHLRTIHAPTSTEANGKKHTRRDAEGFHWHATPPPLSDPFRHRPTP